MFARGQRLRRSEDIMQVMRRGQRVKTPHVILHITTSPQEVKNSRVACIVGKRVHRSAVRRHGIQRRLREIMRVELSRTSMPLDVVVLAQPSIVGIQDFQQVAAEVAKGLMQSKYFTVHRTQE